MKIKFVDIQNFRKLKCCRIFFSDKETLFVGANNSGKTSATDALIKFLDTSKTNNFSVTDFTLSNWSVINQFAKTWSSDNPEDVAGSRLCDWQPSCPSIDVWIDADVADVQKVSHLIPSLKWKGEAIGVRLVYQPKDIESMKSAFLTDFYAANKLKIAHDDLSLWPRDMKDYLDRSLTSNF